MENLFKKIKPQKVSEEIAGQIRALVKEGRLQPGEKLPPERSFAEVLGVGRSSLREAIQILETQGFIEIRNRQGVFIAGLSKTIVPDPIKEMVRDDSDKLGQLYDVRIDIEKAAAAEAARYRTAEDLEKMKASLDAMEKSFEKHVIHLEDDLNFHVALALSGGNIFRGHILKNIFDISKNPLKKVMRLITQDPGLLKNILVQHQEIYGAVKDRDPGLAEQKMAAHLLWVKGNWADSALPKL